MLTNLLMKKRCYFLLLSLMMIAPSLSSCGKKAILYKEKAHVEFMWRHHFSTTKTGWLEAYGEVINRGGKRADWVKVTYFILDKESGVVLGTKSEYIVDGSGPNRKSLEPGQSANFRIRLNSKKKYPYKYERKVTWSETM